MIVKGTMEKGKNSISFVRGRHPKRVLESRRRENWIIKNYISELSHVFAVNK